MPCGGRLNPWKRLTPEERVAEERIAGELREAQRLQKNARLIAQLVTEDCLAVSVCINYSAEKLGCFSSSCPRKNTSTR